MENENTPMPNTETSATTSPETVTNLAGDTWTPSSTESLANDETRVYDENGDEMSFDVPKEEEKTEHEEIKKEEPEAQPEFDKAKFEEMSKEYNEMKSFFENAQRNPEVLKQLYDNFSKQSNPNQTQPQVTNSTWDKFDDVELDDPAKFAQGIRSRMQAEIQPIREFISYLSQYMPHIQSLVQSSAVNNVNKIISDFSEKYGDEAKTFLKEGTKEFNALTAKIQNNPQLSLEEAFLLVKPQFINKQVDAKVSAALAQKRSQSLTPPSNRGANAVSNKAMTLQEAIAAAMKQ